MQYSFKPLMVIVSALFYSSMIFPVSHTDFQDKDSPLHPNHTSKKYDPVDIDTKLPLLQKRIEAGSEFQTLSTSSKNFKQSSHQAACILYSFLYGVSQNKTLSKNLENLLSKDKNGNYYVNDIKIAKGTLTSASSEKHPSKSLVLRALGEYVIEKMENELGIPHFENYVLTNWEGKDLFFDKPIVAIPHREWIESGISKFQKDGSINIKNVRYSGDFVVSWSRSGRARSMYFTGEKWQSYDNQLDYPSDITKQNLRSYIPDVDIMLIGNIKTTHQP